jgi:hypothetical protein
MRGLGDAFQPERLSKYAFKLYERFRPTIPEGVIGWAAKVTLNADRIRPLALESDGGMMNCPTSPRSYKHSFWMY